MDRADEDVTRALETVAPEKGWLWDVGCGPGTLACWASDHGWRVVASDISATAVQRARERGGRRDIVWLTDDVTLTALNNTFDAVVDRGTLHGLPAHRHAAWAATMRTHVKLGGFLVVKTHLPPGVDHVKSHPMDTPAVAALLGHGWTLHQRATGLFGGSATPSPPSVMSVFQRVTPE
jgi:chemotaxis protein methyltransferase CheR